MRNIRQTVATRFIPWSNAHFEIAMYVLHVNYAIGIFLQKFRFSSLFFLKDKWENVQSDKFNITKAL